MTENDRLISISKAADMLQVTIETLRQWDKKGVLRSVRLHQSGWRRYRVGDINALLERKYETH